MNWLKYQFQANSDTLFSNLKKTSDDHFYMFIFMDVHKI